MVGFVGRFNVHYCRGGDTEDSLQQVLSKIMEQDVQLWHDLLWCSWGKLELSKCGYHVIHYDFDASGGETIMLNNEHREEIPINAKLGYYKSPKGTYSVWKPAVEYTSPQSFLSEKLLKSIKTASMPKLYAASGCNHNTSRVSCSRTSRAIGSWIHTHTTESNNSWNRTCP